GKFIMPRHCACSRPPRSRKTRRARHMRTFAWRTVGTTAITLPPTMPVQTGGHIGERASIMWGSSVLDPLAGRAVRTHQKGGESGSEARYGIAALDQQARE